MGTNIKLLMALASFVNWFMPVSLAINSGCDFYQYMVPGKYYYIYNVEYPKYYQGAVSCRWRAESPVNTKIILTCDDISLPPTQDCTTDRLSISLTGDEYLTDGHNYCGLGSLSVASVKNKLTVGLFSVWNSRGGRFSCSVTAISENGGQTQPPINNCDCGRRQERRIVGGVDAGVNEFPSMVGLVDGRRRELFCGGTLINKKYVLTAAHCLLRQTVQFTGVVVGEHNTALGNDTSATKLYESAQFIVHANFDADTYVNDIAIIKTVEEIQFSMDVSPACLPFKYSEVAFNGFDVIALGWGTLEYTGPRPDVLQKVNLTVVSNQMCQTDLPNERILGSNICTYTPGKDTCQFDSGGPLLWMNPSNRRLYLTGIVSFGVGCGSDNPAVNTRVSSYLDWIVSKTSGKQLYWN